MTTQEQYRKALEQIRDIEIINNAAGWMYALDVCTGIAREALQSTQPAPESSRALGSMLKSTWKLVYQAQDEARLLREDRDAAQATIRELREVLEQIRDGEPVMDDLGPSFSMAFHVKKLRGIARDALQPAQGLSQPLITRLLAPNQVAPSVCRTCGGTKQVIGDLMKSCPHCTKEPVCVTCRGTRHITTNDLATVPCPECTKEQK